MAKDITDLEVLEDDLTPPRRFLESLIEASPGIVFRTRLPDYVPRYISPNVKRVWGYDPEEVQGRKNWWFDHLHPEDRDRVKEIFETAMESEDDDFKYAYRFRCGDGEYSWFRSFARFIRDESGAAVEMVGYIVDISAEVEARERLEALAAFPRLNPNPVVEFDATKRVRYLNPAAERLADEQDLADPSELLPEDTWSLVMKTLEEGEVLEEVEAEVGDRTLTWSFYPVSSSSVVHGYAHDVTEQRRLEAQLRHSQKLKAVGTLAGGVAHDFNNVLTAILGNTEMLLSTAPEDSDLAEGLGEIRQAADRATTLTRQLLAFSRKQVLRPEVVDPNEVLGDLKKMLDRLIGEEITFVSDLESDVGRVRVDPGQLEQVVTNLVVNARDAVDKGGRITLRTRSVELEEVEHDQRPGRSQGPHVEISVSDDGVGMDRETADRIFEPFFTTKPEGEGTGLGLSTVHGIVNQSGGDVWVYSEPGLGSTFKVYLPRLDDAAESESPEPVVGDAPEQPKISARVLLVEDEAMVRRLARRILEEAGHSVQVASDAAEALEIVSSLSEPVDILVSDVVLPSMRGDELARELRTRWPGVPVLLMSGYMDHEVEVPEDGSRTFLEKPFSPRELREAVDGLLSRQAG